MVHHSGKHRLTDRSVRNGLMGERSDTRSVVVIENAGVPAGARLIEYCPILDRPSDDAEYGGRGEYYKYVYEWDEDEFVMVPDQSRIFVHDIEYIPATSGDGDVNLSMGDYLDTDESGHEHL
jgi:hypothetical protein